MQRSRSNGPEFDYSEVGNARRCAIRALDDYGCSSAEIAAMFGVSKSTFHRYDLDVRLTRRPASDEARTHITPVDAREIAIITLIRSGEYQVSVIAEALGLSIATIYRARKLYYNQLGSASQAEMRHIHRYLKNQINNRDTRSKWQRRIEARERKLCKRRRGFGPRYSG